MDKFICPICERAVDDAIIPFHKNVERQILTLIQKYNPRWVESDGTNAKCIDYYKALLAHKRIEDPRSRMEKSVTSLEDTAQD